MEKDSPEVPYRIAEVMIGILERRYGVELEYKLEDRSKKTEEKTEAV
jgi:hypothetical protein